MMVDLNKKQRKARLALVLVVLAVLISLSSLSPAAGPKVSGEGLLSFDTQVVLAAYVDQPANLQETGNPQAGPVEDPWLPGWEDGKRKQLTIGGSDAGNQTYYQKRLKAFYSDGNRTIAKVEPQSLGKVFESSNDSDRYDELNLNLSAVVKMANGTYLMFCGGQKAAEAGTAGFHPLTYTSPNGIDTWTPQQGDNEELFTPPVGTDRFNVRGYYFEADKHYLVGVARHSTDAVGDEPLETWYAESDDLESGWEVPQSWQDPDDDIDGNWANEEDAYNNNTGNSSSISVPGSNWSNNLELTLDSPTWLNQIKFYADYNAAEISSVAIQAYANGTYHTVYAGGFANQEWVTKPIHPVRKVTKVKFNFFNSHVDPKDAHLRDVDLGKADGFLFSRDADSLDSEDDFGAPNMLSEKVGGFYYMTVTHNAAFGIRLVRSATFPGSPDTWSDCGMIIPTGVKAWCDVFLYDSTIFHFEDQYVVAHGGGAAGGGQSGLFSFGFSYVSDADIEGAWTTCDDPFYTYDHTCYFGRSAVLWEDDGVHGNDNEVLRIWADGNETSTGAVTDIMYYEEALISLGGNAESDFGDVRFTEADGETEIYYYLDAVETPKVNNDYAVFFVEVPAIDTSSGATIFLYYGKSGASTTSDAGNTFEYLNDGSTTDGLTQIYGSVSVVAGMVRHDGDDVQAVAYRGYYMIDAIHDFRLVGKCMVRSSEGLHKQAGFTYWSKDDSNLFIVQLDADDNLVRINNMDGGGWQANKNYATTITGGTSYKLEIVVDQNDLHTVLFESEEIAHYTRAATAEGNRTGIAAVSTSIGDGGSRGDFDWWYVTKYVFIEPYFGSVSSEQTLSITQTPSTWSINSGSPIAESGVYSTGTSWGNLTNTGTEDIDVTISVGNMTGGNQWTPSDTGTPGNKIFGLRAGLPGGAESLAPTGNVTWTNLDGNHLDVDDDPDSPDANWADVVANTTAIVAHVSFPSPTGGLTEGAGLQEFKVWIRKDTAGDLTPQSRIDLYENGGLVTSGTLTNVTSTSGQLKSFTWDAADLTNVDGSGVEAYIYGTSASAENAPVVGNWTAADSAGVEVSEIELTKPGDVAVGDLLLLIVGNDDASSATWNALAGWTLEIDIWDGVSDAELGVYWRIANGNEGATATPTASDDNEMYGWYIRVTGADTSTPIHKIGTAVHTTASPYTVTEANTTTDNCLVFYASAYDGGDAGSFTEAGAGWAEVDEQYSGAAQGDACGVWGTKTMSGQGVTGDVSITLGVADGTSSIQFAVAPAISYASIDVGAVEWNVAYDSYSIIVKGSNPNNLVTNMAGNTTQEWGMEYRAPTDWDDAVPKSGNVTLTAALAS